jgi:hypothetical protein
VFRDEITDVERIRHKIRQSSPDTGLGLSRVSNEGLAPEKWPLKAPLKLFLKEFFKVLHPRSPAAAETSHTIEHFNTSGYAIEHFNISGTTLSCSVGCCSLSMF